MSGIAPKPGDPVSLSGDADSILRAVRGIVRSVTIHSKRLYRETGMTLPQVLCLRAIGTASQAARDVTAAQVARSIQLSPATVTGIIDRLERGELIERERDTADRRKVYLRLTPKGQEWLSSLPSSLQDRAVERLNGLAPEHRKRILDTLNEVLQLMEAENIETSPILVPGEQPTKQAIDIHIDMPEEDWDKIFAVDLRGYFLCAQAAGRVMVERRKGNIINISTQQAFKAAMIELGAYGIAKAGVVMLTRVLARELGSYGIRANSIAPGLARTEFSRPTWGNPEVLKKIEASLPLGRIAEPDDFVGAALFLASDASSYVTGHTILMEGGGLA